jgi:acetyltransferase-like isoleucine patch superfamily enzyme
MTDLESSDRAPQLLVAPGVVIPDDAVIGANVVIRGDVVLGRGVVIEDAVILGKVPTLGAGSASPPPAAGQTRIGDGAIVGSHTVVNVGARIGANAYVGDHVLVREGARLGAGSAVGHGCSVSRDVQIGDRTRMQASCALAPGTVIEEDCLLGPLVAILSRATTSDRTGGLCIVRRGSRIGSGAQILPGVEVGADAVVGAGSVVTEDVPPGFTVVGVPARPLKASLPLLGRAAGLGRGRGALGSWPWTFR